MTETAEIIRISDYSAFDQLVEIINDFYVTPVQGQCLVGFCSLQVLTSLPGADHIITL